MASTQNLYQCRLCLKRTPTRVNIFGGDFPKMLEILTSIKVRENDGLPKYACVQCALDVKSALVTKRRIIKAYKYLTERLRKQTGPSTSNRKTTIRVQWIEKTTPYRSQEIVNPNKPSARKSLKESVDENDFECQNSENITPKIEIKHEALEDCQNSNDSCTTDGFSSDIRDKMDEETTVQKTTHTFTCDVCSESFPRRSALSLHFEKHKKTKCDICDKLIRSGNFKKHMLVHSSGPSVCNLCGVTSKNLESLRSHISKQHRNRTGIVCEECGVKFKTRYYLLLHKSRVHTGVRQFKCNTCGKGFFTQHLLNRHDRATHKKMRPYVCEFCGIGFSSPYSLKTHKRQHTNEKPFVCDHCDEGFRQKVSLRSHLKSKHGIEEAKECICSECGKGFATAFALDIHQRLHASMKCEVCSETFAGQEYLDNHMKEAHGGESELKEDGTQNRVSRRTHLKSKHGIEEAKESICPECDKCFATDYALSVHQKLHTSVNCEMCSESFADQEYLSNHMKEVHEVESEDESQDTDEKNEEP